MYIKEKIYEKTWFMWATLILFAPVGIFLMWKYKRLNKVPRIILSCVFAICFVTFYGNQLNTYNPASRTQTQVNEQTVTNKKVAADKVAAKKVAVDKAVADKAAASSSSTAQSQNNEYTVYITKTGDKYHRAGCRYLSKSQIAISKSDAIGSGYSPCSVCNP